jgi:hypothetical protein
MARRARNEEVVEEPVEVVEEDSGPGMGIDIGICALTTITLIVAVGFLWSALGSHYGVGPLGG